MREPVRIAIIGVGSIAEQQHLPAVRSLDGEAELVGVCDVDGRRVTEFCERNGVTGGYVDVEELLARTKPNLVHVCTPPGTHAALAERIMRAGAWAYVEKPPCASLSELDRIGSVESETGGRCVFVFQQRFGAGAVHLRNAVRDQVYGRPLVAICHTLWYRSAEYYAVPWRGTWESELGGPTMGHGIHAMDLLLSVLGPWVEVRASIARQDRPVETEDLSMALVEFANGCRASIVTSVASPREETYLRFDFHDATIELTHLYGYTNTDWRFTPRVSLTDQASLSYWGDIRDGAPSTHATQLAAIVRAYRGDAPLPTGIDEIRPTMELITALYRSAITGRPVRRSDIGTDDVFYHRLHGDSPYWAGDGSPHRGIEAP
jgi:predicted dehydrogenase